MPLADKGFASIGTEQRQWQSHKNASKELQAVVCADMRTSRPIHLPVVQPIIQHGTTGPPAQTTLNTSDVLGLQHRRLVG